MSSAEAITRPIPSPVSNSPIFGHFPDFLKDRVNFFRRAFEAHGDIVSFRFGWRSVYLVVHPEGVRQVLTKYPDLYDKNVIGYRRLKYLGGDGLVTSEGALWKRQRHTAQPAFEHQRLRTFAVPLILKAAEDLASEWRQASPGTRDVYQDMKRVTLRIAALSLLGIDIAGDARDVGTELATLLEGTFERLFAIVPVPEIIPTANNRRYRRARSAVGRVIQQIIDDGRRRAASAEKREDLLSFLVAAADSAGEEKMSDRVLHDEILTMFIAGHENSANTLAWVFYHLARQPEIREKLEAELASVLGGRAPTVEDIPRLPYTGAVVQEAMRMYPISTIARRANTDDTISDRVIPKGSIVIVSPYVTHRHPQFWDRPDSFDPERFLGNKERARFAFFPFGGGPRVCIGASFAMLETTLLVARLVQEFRLEMVNPGDSVEIDVAFMLRPKTGLPMSIRARSTGG